MMNIKPVPSFEPYKILYYVILITAICAGVLIAVYVDPGQPGRLSALSGGPYVVERYENEVQLFAMPDEDAWTADIGFAQRYGTMAQAQRGRDKIGAGHVEPVREVVK